MGMKLQYPLIMKIHLGSLSKLFLILKRIITLLIYFLTEMQIEFDKLINGERLKNLQLPFWIWRNLKFLAIALKKP